jgi:ABC-type nitrate/sulfonate/bicarbonate transport system substrate-binding protein
MIRPKLPPQFTDHFIRALMFLLVLISSTVNPILNAGSTSLSFQADWINNGQFAGFFWAIEEGLYEEAGLDLEFDKFEFGGGFMERVINGEAQFGTAESYILIDALNKGAPLVVLGAVFHQSPAGYIYLKETDIDSPKDLNGKRVGVHAYADSILPYFIKHNELDADSIESIKVGHDMQVLLDGEVDLHQGYAIDEFIRIQNSTTRQVDIISFETLGLPMYAMLIYTTRSFAEEHPEQVRAFLKASQEGWVAALAHPEKTQVLIGEEFPDERVDTTIIADQIRAMRPYMTQQPTPLLSLSYERWEAMLKALARCGLIESGHSSESFFIEGLTLVK